MVSIAPTGGPIKVSPNATQQKGPGPGVGEVGAVNATIGEEPSTWEKIVQAIANTGMDIANTAPRALRTGLEMAPALETQSEGIPALARWVIKNSPFTSDEEKAKALADFEASYGQVTAGKEKGPFTFAVGDYPNPLSVETIRKNVTDPLLGPGQDVEAKTFPGKVVQRGLELGPSVLLGPGNLLQKSTSLLGASVAGPGARKLAEGAGWSPAWQEAADVGGTMIGGMAPDIWNRTVNPNPIPEHRQQFVDTMQRTGVPLSVGQRTGSRELLRKEAMSGGPEVYEEQLPAFTRAVARTQGGFPPETEQLTNQAMRGELQRMGGEFDRLINVAGTPLDNNLLGELGNEAARHHNTDPQASAQITNAVNALMEHAIRNNDTITGRGYQNIREDMNNIIRNTDDNALRGSAINVVRILDRAINARLSPADQEAFNRVRQQYRDYLSIEAAKSGQGETKREGFLTPQNLQSGIQRVEGQREATSGQRPLTDLAQAGGATMVYNKTSGTAENLREILSGMMTEGGAALGEHFGLLAHLPEGVRELVAMAGGASGWLYPKVRNFLYSSEPGQRFIGRNLAPRIPGDRGQLADLIMAARAAQLQRGQQSQQGP